MQLFLSNKNYLFKLRQKMKIRIVILTEFHGYFTPVFLQYAGYMFLSILAKQLYICYLFVNLHIIINHIINRIHNYFLRRSQNISIFSSDHS